MPFYKDLVQSSKVETALDKLKKEERIRIIQGLITLREGLAKEIPTRTQNDSLLLATWNIREFAPKNKGGARLIDTYFYIAEIIAAYDLVAVQEVRDDLAGLNQVLRILGSDWQCIYTDVSDSKNGGNLERMAFVFDTRKVKLSGLSGEIVLRQDKIQFARTPFVCGFKSGWTDFILATVHMFYGDSIPEDPRRLQEIKDLAEFIKIKSEKDSSITKNWIALGDFNIFKRTDATMKALTDAGFKVPSALAKDSIPGSNVAQDKFYDQIAFRVDEERIRTREKAGVFDLFQYVFKTSEEATYLPYLPEGHEYKTWRTFQMSDHLPMWVEMKIDYSTEYLKEKLNKFVG